MRKFLRFAAAAAAILLLASCKSFLDVKPKGKVIPETDEEYLSVLNGMLYQVETYDAGEGTVIPGPTELAEFEAITDNLDANLEDYMGGEKSGLPLYQGSEINKRQYMWKYNYEYIRNCNIILEAMQGRGSGLAAEMSAACLAIKGICYYNLMRAFCLPYNPAAASGTAGLPLVKTFDIEERPQRSTLRETGEYICGLLEESIRMNLQEEDYIFTSDVAKAFLAKTLFWLQDWDGALELCEELLGKYPLSERAGYSTMIQELNKRSGEIIVKSYTEGSDSDYRYTNAKKAASRRPINKTLIDLFGADPGKDVRWSVTVGARRMNKKTICGRVRSSELCLMAAECYAHKGEDGEALKKLNLLRSKRIENASDYTMETLPEVGERLIAEDCTGQALTPLLSAIFDERRKELFLEGDRWYELKRNGRPEMFVISNMRKYTTYKYLYTFPINRNDVDLGKLEQNDGYKY